MTTWTHRSLCLGVLVLVACSSDSTSPQGTNKTECFDSTYATIQATIFEAKGCTASVCHGGAAEGELDLRADVSHGSLIRVPSTVDAGVQRVFPGDQDLSLLYLKLKAGVDGSNLGALGQAMPVGADPITEEELEAVRLWIRGGARAEGVVDGTMERLACTGEFDPQPNLIEPLPVPDPTKGLQFYSGAYELSAESEDEVCFVTYYDVTDVVPDEAKLPCGDLIEDEPDRDCFAFKRSELAQDGQSHHSITSIYLPHSDPNGGDWFRWACLGGERNGEECDPTVPNVCGERAACATPPESALACIDYFYAPNDFSLGGGVTGESATRERLITAQESIFIEDLPEGVYSVLPLEGFIAWNSHAFNLTKEDTTIEQWINLDYAMSEEHDWLRQQIFEADRIFDMGPIPPFEKNELCATFELPQYTRILSLSSHFHQRGELFRMWLPPNEPCFIGCEPSSAVPDYENRVYDDPVELFFEEPVRLDGPDKRDRSVLACAIYDNGADNPMEVKRHSTRPRAASCNNQFAGCGCPASVRQCLGGDRQGTECDGDDDACGEGGVCDACPLEGGVTTDDEMFISFGTYYVETS